MSENEQRAFALSRKTLETIIGAANCCKILTAEKIAGISDWLEDEFERAVSRARKKPLAKTDVDRLSKTYRKFCDVIESLQDRTLPPPRVPVSNGSTAWEEWEEIYEQFGCIAGRRESSDWLLIGALLALYETLSGKPASASQANGPTMRFLVSALNELALYAQPDIRSNFEPPKANALKHQLPGLNRLALRQAKRQLVKIVGAAGQ
jgi:hypothetical protein